MPTVQELYCHKVNLQDASVCAYMNIHWIWYKSGLVYFILIDKTPCAVQQHTEKNMWLCYGKYEKNILLCVSPVWLKQFFFSNLHSNINFKCG